VGEGSLYAPLTFTEDQLSKVISSIGHAGLQLDLYCPWCKASSTFQLPPVKGDLLDNVYDPYEPLPRAFVPQEMPAISSLPQLTKLVRSLELRCARSARHRIEFILRLAPKSVPLVRGPAGTFVSQRSTEHTLVKIGQNPPHAELVAGRLTAISKFAEEIDAVELRRAVGLSSYDVAIGAFIYLRRVFERIIDRAWQRALDDGESMPDSTSMRMTEKVNALKHHLPDIVVQNAKVYGILSRGVHELTEADCARTYPVVEKSVIAMLEDAHAHIEKQRRDKDLAADVARLSAEIEKKP
jgi:hypothetical protein